MRYTVHVVSKTQCYKDSDMPLIIGTVGKSYHLISDAWNKHTDTLKREMETRQNRKSLYNRDNHELRIYDIKERKYIKPKYVVTIPEERERPTMDNLVLRNGRLELNY